jgi:DivIVA domain-containing protein
VAKDDAAQRRTEDELLEASAANAGTGRRSVVPPEIRNVSFHAAVRGYDRDQVDAYVKQVNRIIAELEVSSSPRAAVRHALDRVGDQVHGILQRARETADDVTSGAVQEAEEITARAKAEAAEIVVNASTEADAVKAEAGSLASVARAESEEILARARSEAEQIVSTAQAQASEHMKRTEGEADAIRKQAALDLRGIEQEVDSIVATRDDLLDEIRLIAEQLNDLVGAKGPEETPAGDGAEPGAPAASDEPAVALDER